MVQTFAEVRRIPGVRAYLGMTLSDRNAHAVPETLAAVAGRVPGVGWGDVHLNVYTVSGHYYANEGAPLRAPSAMNGALAEALRVREASWDPADLLEAAYLRRIPEHLKTGRSPIPCKSLSAGVFIGAEGDVFPCTVYGRRLGNILETPLYEILDGEEAAGARDVIAKDKCPGCWSPCEAHPTILASAPESLVRR